METTLVAGGRAVALDEHLRRLESSLRAVHGTALPADVQRRASDAAAGAELGRLRVIVAPGGEVTIEVAAVDEAELFPAATVELVAVAVPGGIGAHKWADRRLLERAEALAAPALPLLVDSDGSLLEGARGNVFLVREGALLTPPLDGRILPGITRAQAIEAAGELGLEVHERALGLAELAEADEVFLTSAVRGVRVVRAGGAAAQIAAALRRAWLG